MENVIKSATKVWNTTHLIQSGPKSPVSWTESRISLLPLFIPLSFNSIQFSSDSFIGISLSFYFSVLTTHLNTDDLTGINGIQIQPLFSLSNKCLGGRWSQCPWRVTRQKKKQEFIATLFYSGTVCNHKFFISSILQRMVCLHKYIRQGTSISFNSQFVSAQQMPMADLIGLFNMQLRRHNARCREQRRSDWTLRTADALFLSHAP